MASDAFIVGEDWISEHFFNTDVAKQSFQARVLQRRKLWDEESDLGQLSARDYFASVRGELVGLYARLEDGDSTGEARAELSTLLKEQLGFGRGLYELEQDGPVACVNQRDLDEPTRVVVIDASAVDEVEQLLEKAAETLTAPYLPPEDGNHPITSVSRLLSHLFAPDDGPAFALVLAGRWLLLTDKQRWPEGRYLALNLQLAVDRNDQKKGGEVDRALACIAAESLLPDAEGTVWWDTVFEESIKHTVGVSKDLREGVRSSIEIIANEVVRRRSAGNLDPLPPSEAQPLAKQALRYLYRILFLLFAEASPELKVVPVGASEYGEGYSLDRLRELVLVDLSGDSADRTHFYDSLGVLFRLVDGGHSPAPRYESAEGVAADAPQGLTFNSLTADLFRPAATAHIDEVGLGDEALRAVLARLLLSKEQASRDRGFISYSDLGINQLGAVYEGLMSYTGFFATTDLFEVAKDGDSSKGSWVVPVERSDGIDRKDFVEFEDAITGEHKPVLHPQGSFVFRLAGRERQQSASYYTPEVLTRFVVGQALEELLDQDGHTTTADEILGLTVCEPALGSGAFAIEAVRQLADEYLKRREVELGERVDPEERPTELQKVKASIALHQVYGVDLNATAVELAEISLWLDTMVEGLSAPWFGLHLKRGNSLIGARRAVYSRDQVNSKAWLKDVPRDVPVSDLADNLEAGRVAGGTAGAIHHFLLPAEGWGAAVGAKEAKELAPKALAALKTWKRGILSKPSKKQIDELVNLSYRVEALWQFALRRLTIAEREAQRDIRLWGQAEAESRTDVSTPVSRSEIERKLNDQEGAVQRLRRVMDAWNALWFWPLTDTLTEGATPPSLDEWIEGLTALLGRHFEAKTTGKTAGGETLGLPSGWEELGLAEELDLGYAGARPLAEVLIQAPWLGEAERLASQQGFLHWELDFVSVFKCGGFDLQVGNPPWVRPIFDESSLLAEGDPRWQLATKVTQLELSHRRTQTLADPTIAQLVLNSASDIAAITSFISSPAIFPHLGGLQPDLYRGFMELVWRNSGLVGVSGLIHYDTHFSDERAALLRQVTYRRLRRHWEFVNELRLFEIQHQKRYGVNIYSSDRGRVDFLNATSLYHPDTVVRSLAHDGSGPEPGLKDDNGHWDLRAHRSRVVHVDLITLRDWHLVMENDSVPVEQTRMVFAVNRSASAILHKLATLPRLSSRSYLFSNGWHERSDHVKGYFDVAWGRAASWSTAILQGPHIYVGDPSYKSPNPSMLHQTDWTRVDLEEVTPDWVPITSYKPVGSIETYSRAYTHWGSERLSARSTFRVAWRSMAGNSTGERTLIASIIPPGAAHVHGVSSAAHGDLVSTVTLAGYLSSLVFDFAVRVAPKSSISPLTIERLPDLPTPLQTELLLRVVRLNSISDAYAQLFDVVRDVEPTSDSWTGGIAYDGRPGLADLRGGWTSAFPLKRSSDRRQALLETDAIVALSIGLTIDELCNLYRTQFPVLFGRDTREHLYDKNGRLVPRTVLAKWRQKGTEVTEEERTATHPGSGINYIYDLPFVTLDREADMRQAYAHFERILQERS